MSEVTRDHVRLQVIRLAVAVLTRTFSLREWADMLVRGGGWHDVAGFLRVLDVALHSEPLEPVAEYEHRPLRSATTTPSMAIQPKDCRP